MVNDTASHSSPLLKPDPACVVIRPFSPAEHKAEFVTHFSRSQRISDWLLALDPVDGAAGPHDIMASLSEHHPGVDLFLLRRLRDINELSIATASSAPSRREGKP